MKVTIVGILAFAVLACPMASFAQSKDTEYCKALSEVWRAYNGKLDPAVSTANALTQCNRNPGSAIPVLEKALTDDKIKLPSRG
ncbi:MAG TPA: hypothetical protein VGJ56_18950 [Reyranella sp.]